MTSYNKKNTNSISDYKIILLTGPIASGKHIINLKLISTLKILGFKSKEVLEVDDLYIPFAIKNKFIQDKIIYKETEVLNLIFLLNKKYREKIGVVLLQNYLNNKPKDVVYIVKGNNFIKGVPKLKKTIDNLFVIGIYSHFIERFCRYKSKNSYFLRRIFFLKKLRKTFKEKNKLFNINKAINNTDLIIENHDNLPNEVEIDILGGLIKNKFIIPKFNLKNTFPDLSSKEKKKKYIYSDKIKKLLDKLVVKNKNIFVIQGGNRYIYDYISKNYKVDVYSKKIICLNKANLFIALNTLLTIKERNELLSKQQINIIFKNYTTLDTKTKKAIDIGILELGFLDIKEFLGYGTRSEIIKIFTDIKIGTPFSVDYKDKDINAEFGKIKFFLKKEQFSFHKKEIIKCIFFDTDFYNRVMSPGKNVLFLDDVFYRGRTFYTLSYILNLIDVPRQKWSFSTLCLNRDSREVDLYGKNIIILDKKLLYKFENRVLGELGYWEEVSNCFKFLDLNLYFNYLSYFIKNKNKGISCSEWDIILRTILEKIKYKDLNVNMIKALINYFIHCKSFNLKIDMDALLDQRSKLSGYCIPFVKYINEYINVTKPGYKRKIFKNKIKQFVEKIDNFYLENKLYFSRLSSLYKRNYLVFDYFYLKKVCKK